MATWDSVSGAKGYLLDVSTSNSFSSYVDGYHGLDVGNVNGRAVTGLNPGTTYYYRVRPYTAASSGGYSNVTTATTEAATGLIIIPTFDSSIIDNPNSAAIQAMINRAIGFYESLFSDPITIEILFRYSILLRHRACPRPFSARRCRIKSFRPIHRAVEQFHQRFESGCNNQQRQQSDCQSAREPVIYKHRAIQCEWPSGGIKHTAGHVLRRHHWPGGPFDGIVTLNSAQPFSFTRPLISGSFDAQRAVEHEIDEVIGLGSYLTPPTYRGVSIV